MKFRATNQAAHLSPIPLRPSFNCRRNLIVKGLPEGMRLKSAPLTIRWLQYNAFEGDGGEDYAARKQSELMRVP